MNQRRTWHGFGAEIGEEWQKLVEDVKCHLKIQYQWKKTKKDESPGTAAVLSHSYSTTAPYSPSFTRCA